MSTLFVSIPSNSSLDLSLGSIKLCAILILNTTYLPKRMVPLKMPLTLSAIMQRSPILNTVEALVSTHPRKTVPNRFLQSRNPNPQFRSIPQSQGLFLASHLPHILTIPNLALILLLNPVPRA